MIGLDTTVLVRILVQDDPAQARAATALIGTLTDATPGFISREVLVELVWVLERAYGLRLVDAFVRALDGLLDARELVIEAAERVAVAVDRYRKGGPGFANQMVALVGQKARCETSMTFDRKAAALRGMRLIKTARDR